LTRVYGKPPREPARAELDELVLTVLSQHTSDVNCERAFQSLKRRWATWEQVSRAPVEAIAESIRSGGIGNLKARRIKQILSAVEASEGRPDLSRLRSLPDEEARSYLTALPGVGPKTAACVLLFSLRRPAFPVDTHIHRVARRLGLVPDHATADATQEGLEPAVSTQPGDLGYDLHVLLIRHGREICKSARPRCSECCLLDLCSAGPRLLAAGAAL